MKFSAKRLLNEAHGPGTGPEGFLGDISDIEQYPVATGKGISNPKNSLGNFATQLQNNATFKPQKTIDNQQLDQIQNMIYTFLGGDHIDPRQVLYNLRSRLNHMGLDFEMNRSIPLLPGTITLYLSRFGKKFGTTPTTNLLTQGFDRGEDYTNVNLTFDLQKGQSGNYYFRNIMLQPGSDTMNTPSQANENFYTFIVDDEYLFENVFTPIMINIQESIENETLTEEKFERQLRFIIERTAKRLNMSLTESQIKELTNGLYVSLFESDVGRYNEMSAASGKPSKLKQNRKAAMERLKAAVPGLDSITAALRGSNEAEAIAALNNPKFGSDPDHLAHALRSPHESVRMAASRRLGNS
jgi:hypothetical protein